MIIIEAISYSAIVPFRNMTKNLESLEYDHCKLTRIMNGEKVSALLIVILNILMFNFCVCVANEAVNISAVVQGCGNGILDANEECDGINLGGQTCQGLGYSSGVLNCGADCLFDTSNCISGGGGFVPPTPPQIVPDPSPEHPEIPKSLIINNNNAYANSLNVILTLSAQNAFQMAISNYSDFAGVSWEDYNILKNWNLTEGEGKKTIYAKFRSESGGVSKTVSDTIIFDITAPTNVSALKAEPKNKKIELSWINPKDADFAGIKINRSQESYILSPNEGEVIYSSSGTFFIDANLENKIAYFYTVFSCDQAGNYSSGAIVFAIPESSPDSKIIPEIPIIPGETIPEIPPEIFPEIPPEIIPLIPLPPQPPIIPPFIPEQKIKLSDFSLKIKTDTGIIPLEISTQKPRESGGIKIIKDAPLAISIPADKFTKEVKTVTASITNNISSSSYLLKLNKDSNAFETVIPTPLQKGKYNLILNIIYKDGTTESVSVEILIDPYGYIYKRIENQELRITNAVVSLFYLNPKTKKYELWFAEKYSQKNPQITDETGEYFFMVPKGKYYLEVAKENYYSEKTAEFEVIDEIVNINIEIKEIPPLWQKFIWLIVLAGAGLLIIIAKNLLARKRG